MLTLQRTVSLRQVARHPARTVLMVLSIALGVAAWITTDLLDRALGTALRSSATPLGGLADLQVSNGDIGVNRTLASRLAAVPGVRSVRPLLIDRVLLPDLGRRSAVLVGADLAAERPQAMADTFGLTIEGGSAASFLGALLRGENPVLVGAALDRDLPRKDPRFPVLAAGKTRRVTRIGTIAARENGPAAAAALGGHVLLTDLRVAAALTGRADRVSRLDVLLDPAADRAGVRQRLESALGGAGEVVTAEASDERAAEALTGMRIGFSLCGYGALGLGLFLMASTLGVVAAERRGEIGTLRALGADRGQVWRLFLGEAALLGVLGSALGIPLGYGLARLGLGPLFQALSDVYLPLEARGLSLEPFTMTQGLLAGTITTLLAALLPSARAAWQTPLEAMSREPADAKGTSSLVGLPASALLIGLGAVGYALGDRLTSTPLRLFGPLLLVLLGTVLALPALSALALRLLRPLVEGVLGLPGRLAADHLIRTPGRSGFVVAALAGGMALILQTGGVIHGNAEAVRDWIDRCLMGDLFVTSGGPLSASGQLLPMRDELGPQIEAEFPGAHAVPMRFHMIPWRLAGHETRVRLLIMDARRYVAANRDHRSPPADLDRYARLIEPDTVLVSENFAALYAVKPGMTITLAGVRGPVPLEVVGIVTDFSCSRGTLIVDRARQGALFDGGGVDVFAIFRPATPTTRATANDEAIRRRIEQSSWAADQGLCVLTRPELRTHILGMVDRIYAVAYIQEVVAAAVAALGVATTLLISLLQRRRELGLLRALGATPGQALGLVLAEAALLTLLGLLFGLLIGVALEWYMLRVVLLEETGFVFPFRFPWAHAAIVAALVALSGGLASLGPALKAARMNIEEAIAFE